MDQKLICPEREYLEKVYIDYLRSQYPTLDKFRSFANERFNEVQYRVVDRTKEWPRDIRVCLVNQLSLSDTVRLARTCKHWANVITSTSYDALWLGKYLKDFRAYVPSGPIPKEITIPTTVLVKQTVTKGNKKQTVDVKKNAKKVVKILWFDVYQYTATRKRTDTAKGMMGRALGRKTLRTFLEQKKRVNIAQKLPDIDFHEHWRHDKQYPATAFPEWLAHLPQQKATYSINEIATMVVSDVFNNPRRHFMEVPTFLNPYTRVPDPSVTATQWMIRELHENNAIGPFRDHLVKFIQYAAHHYGMYGPHFHQAYHLHSIVSSSIKLSEEAVAELSWANAGIQYRPSGPAKTEGQK